jgi:hypothetical protein
MATVISALPNSDTPYSKKFMLVGDGTEGVFPIDDGLNNALTSFAAALHAGPLRDTLLRAAPTAIGEFNINEARGDEIRIYDIPAKTSDDAYTPAIPRTIYWKNGATRATAGLACTLPVPGEVQPMRSVIEIRLNHSTQG